MKLSEKGYLKIGNSIVGWFENGVVKVTFDPDKIEFEPDDFEGGCCQNGKGHVTLTVEEAKAIHEMLYNYVWEYAFCLTDYDVKLPDDLLSRIKQVDDEFNGEYLRFYEGRIEQAEAQK